MPLHVSSTCAHHQEVTIVLYSIWCHHKYGWPSRAQPMHGTATYRCDDTRGCVMQFLPTDDEHLCSKHVEAWNKIIVKQKCCASSWLITEVNNLRCTVSKTPIKSSVLIFSINFFWDFFILRRVQRYLIHVYWSSCEIPVILVRF